MDLPAQRLVYGATFGLVSRSLLTLGLIVEEAVDLGDGTVEGHNGETVISGVENQVLAHDSQTDEAEITTGFMARGADINAGKTRTEVSRAQQEYE